jgi:hypothetical protein
MQLSDARFLASLSDADEEKFQSNRFVETIKYLMCVPVLRDGVDTGQLTCRYSMIFILSTFALFNGVLVGALTPGLPQVSRQVIHTLFDLL